MAYIESTDLVVIGVQELCESRGGRPGLPVPNSPYGLCGRKATLNDCSELLPKELDHLCETSDHILARMQTNKQKAITTTLVLLAEKVHS